MKLNFIFSVIVAIFTFFLFAGDTSLIDRLIYAFILFISVFGLLEVFRMSWDWLSDVFKK